MTNDVFDEIVKRNTDTKDTSGYNQPRPGPILHGIAVTYVTPSGIACVEIEGAVVAMRVCCGHLFAGDDGLITEMRSNQPPIPWKSEAIKNEALTQLNAYAVNATEKDRQLYEDLLQHVQDTPFYAVEEEEDEVES